MSENTETSRHVGFDNTLVDITLLLSETYHLGDESVDAGHRVSRPRGTGSVGDSVGEGEGDMSETKVT